MGELILLSAFAVLLIVATIAEWRLIRRRETKADAIARAIARGDTDDHRCECCRRVVSIREIVVLHDDATLACLACAEIIRPRGAPCA